MNKKWIKAIAVLGAIGLSAPTFALPSFSRVVSGEATFVWSADTLTISTIGDTTIEWNSFDVASTEHLYFNQAAYSNWVQNIVLGTAPVQISGTISSNGGVGVSAETIAMNGSIAAHSVALGMGDSRPMPLPSAIRPIVSSIGNPPLWPSNGAVFLSSNSGVPNFQSFNVGESPSQVGRDLQLLHRLPTLGGTLVPSGAAIVAGGTIQLVNRNGLQPAGGSFDPSSGAITLVSSVPEPETYAMFLAGFAWMGVVARRRKQRNA
jgi:filamentous hemagglutinin family protein